MGPSIQLRGPVPPGNPMAAVACRTMHRSIGRRSGRFRSRARRAWGLWPAAALIAVGSARADAPEAGEKVRILVTAAYARELQDLAQRHPQLEFIPAANARELVDKAPGCVAVIGLAPGAPVGEIIRASGEVKWIQTMSAGVESYLRARELKESDIILTNGRIIQGPEIADHAFALLLSLTRDLKFYHEQMKKGFERTSRLPLKELRGKTMLIVGLGGIGTQVAERAHAFGMTVLAVDPKDLPYTRAVEYCGKPDELAALLPRADVVVSCVPETARSHRMLGAEEFKLMKAGVYVINVSRGPILDTEALTEALRSGKVAGAGLDVTDPEPLPSDHPLWAMPNVVITPHIAGQSDAVQARRVALFRDNVERFVSGRPLRNVVDKSEGY